MMFTNLLIGFSPMLCKFQLKFVDRMTVYGAGLLVGASLLVVIPEGVMTLVGAFIKPNLVVTIDHNVVHCIGTSLCLGFTIMTIVDQLMIIRKEYKSDKV